MKVKLRTKEDILSDEGVYVGQAGEITKANDPGGSRGWVAKYIHPFTIEEDMFPLLGAEVDVRYVDEDDVYVTEDGNGIVKEWIEEVLDENKTEIH